MKGKVMAVRPDKLIFVYDGDSGVGAMLLDVVKKAVGREDCALCEITYSPVGKRRAWANCEGRLGVAVQELHRDQVPPAWGLSPTSLPCVLARAGGETPWVLLARHEIRACHARPDELERRLRHALDARIVQPAGDAVAIETRARQ